jgi:hypothetical protein
VRKRVPADSRWEAQITESMLYGTLNAALRLMAPELKAAGINFKGVTLEHASSADAGMNIHHRGLVIHMASGDYRVTIERRP